MFAVHFPCSVPGDYAIRADGHMFPCHCDAFHSLNNIYCSTGALSRHSNTRCTFEPLKENFLLQK